MRKTHESVIKSAGSVKVVQSSSNGNAAADLVKDTPEQQLLPGVTQASKKGRHNSGVESFVSESTSSDDASRHQQRNRLSFLDDSSNGSSSNIIVERNSQKASINSRSGSQRHFLAKLDELKFIDTSIESDLPPTLSSLSRLTAQRKASTHNEANRIYGPNNNNNCDEDINDFDSAVENSSSSMEQNQVSANQ